MYFQNDVDRGKKQVYFENGFLGGRCTLEMVFCNAGVLSNECRCTFIRVYFHSCVLSFRCTFARVYFQNDVDCGNKTGVKEERKQIFQPQASNLLYNSQTLKKGRQIYIQERMVSLVAHAYHPSI